MRKLVTWNGLLVAGGSFPSLGNIAVWNGSAWLPLGPGLPFLVTALTVWNGNLVAAGRTGSDTIANASVQSWDGTTFSALGSGVNGASVDALLRPDNGDVVAGGSFNAAGGVPASNLARWNDTAWSALGNGFDAPVYSLCKMPNGDVIAGGRFTQTQSTMFSLQYVARLGTAHSSFALANAPSLLGAAFFQQAIPLEFDGAGALTAVRGSNALAATIGTL